MHCMYSLQFFKGMLYVMSTMCVYSGYFALMIVVNPGLKRLKRLRALRILSSNDSTGKTSH